MKVKELKKEEEEEGGRWKGGSDGVTDQCWGWDKQTAFRSGRGRGEGDKSKREGGRKG